MWNEKKEEVKMQELKGVKNDDADFHKKDEYY